MYTGDRLKRLRKKFKQNQSEIASILNISRESYCMYENGKREPSYQTLISIASLYHVSVEYLLSLTDIPYSFVFMSEKDYKLFRSLLNASNEQKEALIILLGCLSEE